MKIGRVVCGFCLLLVSLLTIYFPPAVLAQEEPPPEEPEAISIDVTYPKQERIAGSNFEFLVELRYTGSEEARYFDLRVTTPERWSAYITPQFEKENRIPGLMLEPRVITKVNVVVTPPGFPLPELGEYKITLEAISDDIKNTFELTAVITAEYDLAVVPVTQRLNTTVTAGKDNFYTIEIQNLGTAPLDNITFSSVKPSGWAIEFSPDKIASLSAIDFQTVDVNIKPPTDTIAGDYQITLRASSEQASEDIKVRVTVETPTIWGWVGVGIIVIVIAGLTFLFILFSRR
jgi:uncharacterized repeat protein (TIGR01451 family)